nr:hypothetical protein [Tanacetum cinerariifolium]
MCVAHVVQPPVNPDSTIAQDSSASFHATYCKEELERFKLRSNRVRLVDDKTLDIAGIRDVVLKTSFGTSWTLKDVRYTLGLKRRLISVGQLDEEVYYVGFGDQQWKVTNGSLVVARRNKRGSPYMVEDWYEHVSFQRQRSKCTEGYRYYDTVIEDYIKSCGRIVMLKMVPETPLQFGVAKRLSRTFRAESMGIHAEALKILWEYSVSTAYLIYRIPYFPIWLRILEEEWRGKDTSSGSDEMRYSFRDTKSHQVIQSKDITFVDLIYGARSTTDSSIFIKLIQKSQVVLVDIPKSLAENDNIVAEHGLSSKITQSPGGSSDTSERSENNESFEDSERSDEEYSKDGASSKVGGSETPHVRRSNRESRAPIRYSPSANYLLLTGNGKPESYSEALSSKESVQWKKAINEEIVSLEKNQTRSLVRLPAGKKASQSLWMFRVKEEQDDNKRYKARLVVKGFQHKREVEYNAIFSSVVKMTTIRYTKSLIHLMKNLKVGDEREVEVLRNFNWPPSELLTEDGVLPERERVSYVRRYQKVRAVSLLKGR